MKTKLLTNSGHKWRWGINGRNLNPPERVLGAGPSAEGKSGRSKGGVSGGGREENCTHGRVAGADEVEHVRLEEDHGGSTDQRDQDRGSRPSGCSPCCQNADGGDVKGEPHRLSAKEDNNAGNSQRNEQGN